jgi:PAS domain S-box-containing protein
MVKKKMVSPAAKPTVEKDGYGLPEADASLATPPDLVSTPILVLDCNGRIVRFNRACEALTGYTFAEVKGQQFWELLVSPDRQTAVEADFNQMRYGRFPSESEMEWLTKNGRSLRIAWSHDALLKPDDTIEYIISAGTNITEREQTALLLNASESLQAVTTALLQHLTTLDDVLAIICTEACRLTGATGSAVLLLQEETWLQVASSSGTPRPTLHRLSIDHTFAGAAIAQKKPLLLNDPHSQKQAYHRNPALKTLFAVPLLVDETLLGVLDVVNKPGGFTSADLRVMQLFANQAAISIEHARLHRQAEKLAVMEERQRLARELHDSVTQALYSVTLYADAVSMALKAGKHAVVLEHVQELRAMAREAMLDMRLLIFELHPPVLEKEGLVVAIQTRLETVEARSGLQSAFHVEGQEIRLPLAIEEDLYRIVQEALTNAVKHAQAQRLIVWLRFGSNHFALEVSDDGVGFDPMHTRQGGGLGLRGIAERVQRIGGQLVVDSTPGKGTILKVDVDL